MGILNISRIIDKIKLEFIRYVYFKYKPVRQLKKSGEYWVSQGSDPAFVIKPNFRMRLEGWYMVELKVCSKHKTDISIFYFDYGNEFKEDDSLCCPLKQGLMSKRLCFFSNSPKVINFVPLKSKSEFSIEHLKFVKVTEGFAKNRMLRKISNNSLDDLLTPKRLKKQFKSHAKEIGGSYRNILYDNYNKLFDVRFPSISYNNWVIKNEKNDIWDNQKIQTKIEQFSKKPLISVILPVYNTEIKYLRLCIESVLNQSYPNLELCIADDASSESKILQVLKEYSLKDPRIKYLVRKKNGHISEASNTTLELVNGEFVALLDHDDQISCHALYEVAKLINKHSDVDIIYSDEDKIDEHGNRFDPHFKTDWNPDLLYSQNYISHLGVYRTEIVRKVGGFRKGFEGSQDYDFLLRCVNESAAERIHHIPKIMYHWRAVEGSTALSSKEKKYTTDAGIMALKDFFARTNKKVRVKKGFIDNTYKVTWPIPDPQPKVSLLIPTRDGYDILYKCVESILTKTEYENYEIIIIDNQSSDPEALLYLKSLNDKPNIRVIKYDKLFNYSSINNFGVKYAKGSIVGLINNDIEVISPDWLTEMVSCVVRDEIGCVGAKLYYPDDTIQHAGVILGIGGVAGHSHKHYKKDEYGYFSRLMLTQNVSAVTAACLLVRKELFERVNGLDEKLEVAFNDIDFCLRISALGYRNLWTPYAELYHHESVSRGYEDNPEKQKRFQKEVNYMKTRWGILLESDPYYNPHLTKKRDDFSIGEL